MSDQTMWSFGKVRPIGRTTTARLMIAVTAMAVVAAACGNGEEALPKEQYVVEANAICQEANTKIEPVFERSSTDFPEDFPDDPTPEQFGEFAEAFGGLVDELTPIFEAMLADLRALPAPEGDQETLAALLGDFEEVLDEINRSVDAAVAGDPDAIEVMFSDDDPFAEVNQRAIAYGLTVCGQV